MSKMLVRNIKETTVRALKLKAARHQTSAEEEARRALDASVEFDRQAFVARLNAFVATLPPQTGPSSTEILRADRDRDEPG